MGTANYLELIHKIEELVSNHNIRDAQKELKALSLDSIPMKMRSEFASLARRAGLVKYALKVLQPNIYGVGQPSHEDVIEYSSTLRKMGLINQALNLLGRVRQTSDSELHKSFCYISTWDYKSAHDHLKEFLKDKTQSEKKVLVGELNLATCLVEMDELDEAFQLLTSLENKAQQLSPHLYLNILETKGQCYIRSSKLEKATEVLGEAQKLSGKEFSNTNLFIEKWSLVARCMKGEISYQSDEIFAFRKKIRQQHHWETLRDFDWQMAKISKDVNLMNYVFFGSPFEAFRKILIKDMGSDSWGNEYFWKNSKQDQVMVGVDLVHFNHNTLPFGLGQHRLLMLMASDFYRPWTIGRIFNSFFPDELFDPVSSHKKVYRMMEKLMKFVGNEVPAVQLSSTEQGYRMRLNPGYQMSIHRKMQFENQESFLFYLLNYHGFYQQSFTIQDVMNYIPMSQHQLYRALKKMDEMGFLQTEKQGKNLFSIPKAS